MKKKVVIIALLSVFIVSIICIIPIAMGNGSVGIVNNSSNAVHIVEQKDIAGVGNANSYSGGGSDDDSDLGLIVDLLFGIFNLFIFFATGDVNEAGGVLGVIWGFISMIIILSIPIFLIYVKTHPNDSDDTENDIKDEGGKPVVLNSKDSEVENKIRENWDFSGSPMDLYFRKK